MDISNSTVKGKLSKAAENTSILSLGEMTTILYACLFFSSIISKEEYGFTKHSTSLARLTSKSASKLSSLLTSRLQKWKKNYLSTFYVEQQHIFFISAEMDYSKSDLTKQELNKQGLPTEILAKSEMNRSVHEIPAYRSSSTLVSLYIFN